LGEQGGVCGGVEAMGVHGKMLQAGFRTLNINLRTGKERNSIKFVLSAFNLRKLKTKRCVAFSFSFFAFPFFHTLYLPKSTTKT